MTKVERLKKAIQSAGVPIEDASIGDPDKRETWSVQPQAMQSQAQPTIDAFVDVTPAQQLDEDAQRETSDKRLQAVAMGLWDCIPSPLLTKAQLKKRIIDIYKTL